MPRLEVERTENVFCPGVQMYQMQIQSGDNSKPFYPGMWWHNVAYQYFMASRGSTIGVVDELNAFLDWSQSAADVNHQLFWFNICTQERKHVMKTVNSWKNQAGRPYCVTRILVKTCHFQCVGCCSEVVVVYCNERDWKKDATNDRTGEFHVKCAAERVRVRKESEFLNFEVLSFLVSTGPKMCQTLTSKTEVNTTQWILCVHSSREKPVFSLLCEKWDWTWQSCKTELYSFIYY